MKNNSIDEYIEKNYSKKRKIHTKGVCDCAKELALKYGANPDKAFMAAQFHDMFRGTDIDIINKYIMELRLNNKYLNNANLAHGKIAAAIMKRDWNIHDEDILNAVSFHTTGRIEMSVLEKVIFLADAIEPARDYPGVDKLRKLAKENLDRACFESLKGTIKFLKQQGVFIDEDTIAARDDLKEELMNSKELAIFVTNTLDNKKALDITIIDIAERSSFADYFVLASGSNERLISALADEVEDTLAKEGMLPKSIEGKSASGWILMDYGDIIVNVLTVDMREKYNIEKVWGDCNTVDTGIE